MRELSQFGLDLKEQIFFSLFCVLLLDQRVVETWQLDGLTLDLSELGKGFKYFFFLFRQFFLHVYYSHYKPDKV